MTRRQVTWTAGGTLTLAALAAADGSPAVVGLIVAVAVLAAGLVAVGRFAGLLRPRGVPTPPTIVDEPGCESGVYKFEVWTVGRPSRLWWRRPRPVAIKAGKSSNLRMRLSGHVTLEDRRIVGEQVIRTPNYHAAEARIHRDLAPWRLHVDVAAGERQRARELYRPCRAVRWYLHHLWRASRR